MLRAAVATPTKLSGLLEPAFKIPQRHVLFMSDFVKLRFLRKLNMGCKPDSLFIWAAAAVQGEGRLGVRTSSTGLSMLWPPRPYLNQVCSS